MKEKIASQNGKNRMLESSRRLKAQWEHKRAELKPDPEALRSWRAGVEWDRKGIHLSVTILAFWTYYVTEPYATSGLVLLTLFVLAVDHFRIRSRRWALWFYRTFPFVFRGDERYRYSGATILMIGITLTSALFPAGPATAGVLCLTWGDSAAALVGQFYQHWRKMRRLKKGHPIVAPAVRKRRHKTWAGTLGCLFVSMFMILLVIGPQLQTILLGGVAAALMERWTHGRWDNLTMPLATAGVIQFSLNWLV